MKHFHFYVFMLFEQIKKGVTQSIRVCARVFPFGGEHELAGYDPRVLQPAIRSNLVLIWVMNRQG